jgi:hypothetical protein
LSDGVGGEWSVKMLLEAQGERGGDGSRIELLTWEEI